MRAVAAILLISFSAFGQIVNGLQWRSIGPAATGGRITDIEVVRTSGRPAEIYVATASGGIFKSSNEGVSWTPVFDRSGGMLSIGAVAVAPSNHSVVWAGTGEADNRQSSSWGDGVYRSPDGGATWQKMGLEETRHIGEIFGPGIALPWQASVEAELTALPDGADDANIGQSRLL